MTSTTGRSRWVARGYQLMAVAAVIAAVAWLWNTPAPARRAPPADVGGTAAQPVVEPVRPSSAPTAARIEVMRAQRRAPPPPFDLDEEPPEVPSSDPDDIAAHIRPGDPEPTAAELIEALQHAGIRSGLGAFNPPGTMPPLEGIAVPDDFELPEGYMRHHQSTDEGEPIEPILMFSPDYEFLDAHGRPIEIPEDRVVPPELAPPGLPIRFVRPPSP